MSGSARKLPRCIRCGYDLSGLAAENRGPIDCPECGEKFANRPPLTYIDHVADSKRMLFTGAGGGAACVSALYVGGQATPDRFECPRWHERALFAAGLELAIGVVVLITVVMITRPGAGASDDEQIRCRRWTRIAVLLTLVAGPLIAAGIAIAR